MSNICKIMIALTLVFCLAIAFMACDDEFMVSVAVTDDDGNPVLDDDGNPVTEMIPEDEGKYLPVTDDDGNTVTDKDGDTVTEFVPDKSTETTESSNTTSEGGIVNAGGDKEEGWGEIIKPSNRG